MKKKMIIFTSLVLIMVLVLSGCSGQNNGEETGDDSKKTVTVTTTFINDMVKTLAEDRVNIELIIPAGSDPHLYEATPEDLQKVENADLLLYHGLHFEGRMEEILEKRGKSITDDFTDDDLIYLDEDGASTIDPHFWFDIGLYEKATEKVADYLIELLPDQEDDILENLENYKLELSELDRENTEKLSEIPENSRYLVTPHDAFNYFSRRYDIEVIAPQGISTDSEVGTADLESTANFIVDNEIKAIFVESTTNPERMEKLKEICASKGFEVEVISGEGNELFSDSLAAEGEEKDSYIEMYKSNVDVISRNLK